MVWRFLNFFLLWITLLGKKLNKANATKVYINIMSYIQAVEYLFKLNLGARIKIRMIDPNETRPETNFNVYKQLWTP